MFQHICGNSQLFVCPVEFLPDPPPPPPPPEPTQTHIFLLSKGSAPSETSTARGTSARGSRGASRSCALWTSATLTTPSTAWTASSSPGGSSASRCVGVQTVCSDRRGIVLRSTRFLIELGGIGSVARCVCVCMCLLLFLKILHVRAVHVTLRKDYVCTWYVCLATFIWKHRGGFIAEF